MEAISRRPMSSPRGFSLIELLIVVAVIGILAAMVIHHLIRARAASNEASAIGSLRALNSAQTAYSSACGRNAYAATFEQLVDGGYASPDMNLSPKSGFRFTMTAGTGGAGSPDCESEDTLTAYYAAAEPVSATHGTRAFATSGNTIWQDTSGAPPEQPFASNGTVGPIQ